MDYYIVFNALDEIVYSGTDRETSRLSRKSPQYSFVDCTLPFRAVRDDDWLMWMCHELDEGRSKIRYAKARQRLLNATRILEERTEREPSIITGVQQGMPQGMLYNDTISLTRINKNDTVKLAGQASAGWEWDLGLVVGMSRDSDIIKILTVINCREKYVSEFIDNLEKVE